MDSPLAAVFLAVIALAALLQATFVGALAFAMRAGRRKLDAMEAEFESTVAPQIRNAARLTGQAAVLSERSLAQAQRVDDLVADASRRAERYLDEAAFRLGEAVERTAGHVEARLGARAARVRAHPLLRKLSGAATLFRAAQRALEMWQATSVAAEDAEDGDGGDSYADDAEARPEAGRPADPSPA